MDFKTLSRGPVTLCAAIICVVYGFSMAVLTQNQAYSATLYVSTSGNNIAPYVSWADASTKIQDAIDCSVSGDTVLVDSGTYSGLGNRDISFAGKLVSLVGVHGPLSTIVNCEGSLGNPHRGFSFKNLEDSLAIVAGLTITGGFAGSDSTLGRGGAVYCSTSSPRFTNVLFEANFGLFGGAVFCERSSQPRFEQCSFIGNSAEIAGGAVYSQESSAVLVSNSTLAGNTSGHEGGAIFIHGGVLQLAGCLFHSNSSGESGGTLDMNYSTGSIRNATITDGASGAHGAAVNAIVSSLDISRSILSFNIASIGNVVSCDSNSNVTAVCTDVFGNWPGDWLGCLAGFVGQGQNLSADPEFCDRASLDFHLQPQSPCSPFASLCGVLIGALEVNCPSTSILDSMGIGSSSDPHLFGYPNPFNGSARVSFNNDVPSTCVVRVFNVLGRPIDTLINAYLPAGKINAEWSPRTSPTVPTPSGVYLIHLETATSMQTIQVTYLK